MLADPVSKFSSDSLRLVLMMTQQRIQEIGISGFWPNSVKRITRLWRMASIIQISLLWFIHRSTTIQFSRRKHPLNSDWCKNNRSHWFCVVFSHDLLSWGHNFQTSWTHHQYADGSWLIGNYWPVNKESWSESAIFTTSRYQRKIHRCI